MSDSVYGTIAQGVNPLTMAGNAVQVMRGMQDLRTQQFNLQQAKLQPAYAGLMALRDNPNASWGDVQQALAQSERLGADISGLTANANEMMANGGKPADYIKSTSLRGMPAWEQFGVVGLTAEQLAHPIQWTDQQGITHQMSLGAAIQQGYNPGIGAGGSFGGAGAAAAGGGGGTPAASSGLGKEAFLSNVMQRESGGRNVPNQQGPGGTPLSTASGLYQIIDPTWREGAALAGVDVNKYPRAMYAPAETQHQVASALYDKYGETPWAASAPGAQQPQPYQVASTGLVAPPAAAAGPPAAGGGMFPGGMITGPSPYILPQFEAGAKAYTADQLSHQTLGQRTAPLMNAISLLKTNPNLQTGPGQQNWNQWTTAFGSMGFDVSGLAGINPNDAAAWQELAKFLKQNEMGMPGTSPTDLARLEREAASPNIEQRRDAIMTLAAKAVGNERLRDAKYLQFQSQNQGPDARTGLPRAATRAQYYNLETSDWQAQQDPNAYAADMLPPSETAKYLAGLTPKQREGWTQSYQNAKRLFGIELPTAQAPAGQ